MREIYKEVVFLSAELSNLSYVENRRRTILLQYMLIDIGASYVKTIGNYKGVREISYMVYLNIPKGITVEELESMAFLNFDQDSILYRNTSNDTTLIYSNGNKEPLGKLVEITELEAEKLDGYTKFPLSNKFVTIR